MKRKVKLNKNGVMVEALLLKSKTRMELRIPKNQSILFKSLMESTGSNLYFSFPNGDLFTGGYGANGNMVLRKTRKTKRAIAESTEIMSCDTLSSDESPDKDVSFADGFRDVFGKKSNHLDESVEDIMGRIFMNIGTPKFGKQLYDAFRSEQPDLYREFAIMVDYLDAFGGVMSIHDQIDIIKHNKQSSALTAKVRAWAKDKLHDINPSGQFGKKSNHLDESVEDSIVGFFMKIGTPKFGKKLYNELQSERPDLYHKLVKMFEFLAVRGAVTPKAQMAILQNNEKALSLAHEVREWATDKINDEDKGWFDDHAKKYGYVGDDDYEYEDHDEYEGSVYEDAFDESVYEGMFGKLKTNVKDIFSPIPQDVEVMDRKHVSMSQDEKDKWDAGEPMRDKHFRADVKSVGVPKRNFGPRK